MRAAGLPWHRWTVALTSGETRSDDATQDGGRMGRARRAPPAPWRTPVLGRVAPLAVTAVG